MRISMTSAKIACNAAVLIPEPATYISSDYANHSSTIISGHNAKTIAAEEIVLAPGFEAAYGSEYVAEIQSNPTVPPTVINFSTMVRGEKHNTKSAPIYDSISNITIYPNPVQSSIYIVGLPDESSTQILIYTISGKLLMESNGGQIDISPLPKGMYIIQVKSNELSSSLKIIKN